MKKIFSVLIACTLFTTLLSAQTPGVSVSQASSLPDASAMLDVQSTTKGFLPPRLTSVQRDQIQNPAIGLVIYNTTTGCLNYRKANAWYEICGTCTPDPSTADAGVDQLNHAGTSTTLAGNNPVNGTGTWTVTSGTGGSFVNANLYSTVFNGQAGQFYTLTWTVSTGCSSSIDQVDISFASVNSPLITLAALRAKYIGTDLKLTTSTQITGVVISDSANKNITKGAVLLQQGTAGIYLYFGGAATNTYALGDSVLIDITGDSLINFSGSLEVKSSQAQRTPVIAPGKTITPRTITIAALNTALATQLGSATNCENTLLKIVNATASGGLTYNGSNTLTDASGNTTLFTKSQATFSSTVLPLTPKTWTGFGVLFNGVTSEFIIRNLSDVQ